MLPREGISPPSRELLYRPELDGLRAVAVLGVLAAHARLPFGEDPGHVGVTAFFVLSGYLITALLVRELDRTGRIDLKAFYIRRLRRLAPALLAFLLITLAIGIGGLWERPWVVGWASAAFYVSNWFRAANVDLGPFGHTWTLAVEEQFYLFWPLVFWKVPRVGVAIALLGLAVGLVARAVSSGAFLEFSTLTRGDAILAGCLVAVSGPTFSRRAGWLGILGLGMAGLLSAPLQLALPLATISSVLLVASPNTTLAPLAAFGKRAYGIYLWDYALASLVGPGIGEVMAVGMGELSYRTVEAHFRVSRKRSAEAKPSPTAGVSTS